MKSSIPLPGPDAAQRMDPADQKSHLNSGGYWNLETSEQTWALFRNVAGPHKTVKEHRRTEVIHQDLANDFYSRFKSIVVSELTLDSFCGGAFKEKVKLSSPFTDILTFVLASPVLYKGYRIIFKTQVAKLYYDIVSRLRVDSRETQESFGEDFWHAYEENLKAITSAFYDARQHKEAAPVPDDISDAWLEEFGPIFTANYKKAVAGDPTAPFRVAKCIRSKHGLSKLCILLYESWG